MKFGGGVGRHVVADDLAEGRRAQPDVEREVDQVAGDRADELAHVGIPLEVEAADRSGPRETLVRLDEADAAHERRQLVRLEVAGPVLLGEIAAMVDEPPEADHLDLGDSQLADADDLHPSSLAATATGRSVGALLAAPAANTAIVAV